MKTKPNHKAAPELNVEVLKRFYEFGGLRVITVKHFHTTFREIISRETFNSAWADAEIARLTELGFIAWGEDRYIKFDGAFATQKQEV